MFTSYVCIAPQLTEAAGFGDAWLTPLLLLFGAGLFVGNYADGKLADRWPNASVLTEVNWIGGLMTTSGLLVALVASRLMDQPSSPAPVHGHHHG